MLSQDSKIYVAGHKGLVGSAICQNLKQKEYQQIVTRTHSQLDLTDEQAVKDFFDHEKPEVVILAAAFVGGIWANMIYRADFLMQNLKIQCNVIDQSYKHGVKKLLFLGSTCIYPKHAVQPMDENQLLTSPLEYTNESYAIAKIAGLKMCESYNLQYGTNFIAVMPTNLYGPNDNFHLENSHVMPAMIRKIYLSKMLNENQWSRIKADLNARPIEGTDGQAEEKQILCVLSQYGIYPDKVTLWGTGSPMREFLWSEDMADACVHIMQKVDFSDIIGEPVYSSVFINETADGKVDRNSSKGRGGAIPALGEIRNCHINIGTGQEISIRELAEIICETMQYKGEISFDASKPDGTPRKLVDVKKLHDLGWRHQVDIRQGVQRLYNWYLSSL